MRPLLLLLMPALALASAPDLFGYGARSQGMAGAVMSSARGHAAVHHNPGLLGFEEKAGFAFGYQYAQPQLKLNGDEREARAATATFIGFDLPLPLGGFMARRLTLGTAFVIPTNSVLVADVPRPGDPRFSLVENRAQTVSLQGAIGLRVTDWLGLGAGFIALSELQGAIDVAPNAEGRIGSQARDQLVADYAPVVGLHLRFAEWLVGLTWRGESKAEFELPITAELGDSFPLPIPELRILGVAQYDPQQLGVEVSSQPLPWLRVALGGSWKLWSAYPNPIEYTAVPEDFPEQSQPGFEDTFELRLGAEFPLEVGPFGLEPRLGYQFAPSPAPEQTGAQNKLVSDRHLSSLGLGWRWTRLRAEVALQWHHLPERSHQKSEGTVKHSGNIFGAAFELGVEL